MRLISPTLLVTLLLYGCANPVNEYTARRYYSAGQEAERAGNFTIARENYRRALINAQIGHLGPAAEADAAGKLARIQGNLCEHDEAEKTLLYALASEEKVFGLNDPRTFSTRLELAQLTYDVGKYDKAVSYYEKAFDAGGAQLEATMALGYADLLDDYATALAQIGRTLDSERTKIHAKTLRDNAKSDTQGAIKSRAKYVPYPKTCK